MINKKATDTLQERAKIIQTVQKPLGFFTLVVLVVEAIFGIIATLSQGADRTYLVVGMICLMFLLVGIVAFLAYKRPGALTGESDNLMAIVLHPKSQNASVAVFKEYSYSIDTIDGINVVNKQNLKMPNYKEEGKNRYWNIFIPIPSKISYHYYATITLKDDKGVDYQMTDFLLQRTWDIE